MLHIGKMNAHMHTHDCANVYTCAYTHACVHCTSIHHTHPHVSTHFHTSFTHTLALSHAFTHPRARVCVHAYTRDAQMHMHAGTICLQCIPADAPAEGAPHACVRVTCACTHTSCVCARTHTHRRCTGRRRAQLETRSREAHASLHPCCFQGK